MGAGINIISSENIDRKESISIDIRQFKDNFRGFYHCGVEYDHVNRELPQIVTTRIYNFKCIEYNALYSLYFFKSHLNYFQI